MNTLGKMLLLFGGLLVVMGLVLTFADKIPWIGKLPGDVLVRKGNFEFYFPIATCLLLSLILTIFFSLFGKK